MLYEFEIPYYRIAKFGFFDAEHLVALAFPNALEIWVCRDIRRLSFKVKVVATP